MPETASVIQQMADDVVKPDDYFSRLENWLLVALLYLVHADGTDAKDSLLQCRRVLREAAAVAAAGVI
jgi:hypothetical protein